MRRMWLMRSADVRVVLGFVVHCRPILMRKRREGRREIWRRSGVLEALWGSVMAGRDGMGVVKVLSTGSSGVLVWTLKETMVAVSRKPAASSRHARLNWMLGGRGWALFCV